MKKEKFVIKDILTNKKKLDRRYYLVQRFKQFLAAFILGSIFGALFGCYLTDGGSISIGSPEVVKQTIEVKAQEDTTPKDKYQLRGYARCYDVEICIRDIGEELGFLNKDILIAINISRAESGFVEDRISPPNKNGTFDIGAMQINDVHNKRISRADRLDMEKNITFAYQLRKEQGNWNAWSVCRGKVNCN